MNGHDPEAPRRGANKKIRKVRKDVGDGDLGIKPTCLPDLPDLSVSPSPDSGSRSVI
jgi:hypothetical protein